MGGIKRKGAKNNESAQLKGKEGRESQKSKKMNEKLRVFRLSDFLLAVITCKVRERE